MKRLFLLIFLSACFGTISPHTKFITVDEDTVALGASRHRIDLSGNSDIKILDSAPGDQASLSKVPSASIKEFNKLTLSVSTIDEKSLKKVNAGSVFSALSGKSPGLIVLNPSGEPGKLPSISLRGSSQLTASQFPLIILDGAILEGTLNDINADDIESVEVMRGPAASALYGSRGGNGVIEIKTLSGNLLQEGKTEILFRNEYGINRAAGKYNPAIHHAYRLAGDQSQFNFTKYEGVTYPDGYTGTMPGFSGTRTDEDDQYMDNAYAALFDHEDLVLPGNDFLTNYISAGANLGKFNYMASFENHMQSGILSETNGFRRNSFRVNFDYRIIPELTVSATNLYVRSKTEVPGGVGATSSEIFMNTLLLSPDADITVKNPDGQPFNFIPDAWTPFVINPLYLLRKIENETERNRFAGTYRAKLVLMDLLNIEALYSFQYLTTGKSIYAPYDTYTLSDSMPVYSHGSLSLTNSSLLSGNAMLSASISREFGDITAGARLCYLLEKMSFSSDSRYGEAFSRPGTRSFDDLTINKSEDNFEKKINSNYITGLFYAWYREKYLLDGAFCYSGTSLSDYDGRWHPWMRISAAYRLTQDFEIPGVNEMRLRMAFGTAGYRPGFQNQFEVFSVSSGNMLRTWMGNSLLKPSLSREFEAGLNIDFLDRFSFEIVRSVNSTRDQTLLMTLPAQSGELINQVMNSGRMTVKSWEASLKADVIKTKYLDYSLTLVVDRIRQKITKLDVPPFRPALPGEQEYMSFYFREGETPGAMYGYSWVRSLEEMKNQLAVSDLPSTWWDDSSIDSYVVNSDGYVIVKGTEGTTSEIPVKKNDTSGMPLFSKIGDSNPNFRIWLSNSLSFNGIGIYALLEWKNGGDIYNRTAQNLAGHKRLGMMDQFRNPDFLKKAIPYYMEFYDNNSFNDFWVEDGSYLKLRELALFYEFPAPMLKDFSKGYVKSLKLSLTARNIFTLTNYSGYDPEVLATDSYNYYAYDYAGYPHCKSYSLSVELKF